MIGYIKGNFNHLDSFEGYLEVIVMCLISIFRYYRKDEKERLKLRKREKEKLEGEKQLKGEKDEN
ncbi:MAG: hypothetical protein HQK63_07035 [Desulfamplus sp.]|nr:hypothetical protein [Desulfamplus sp.]